jgi:uncharacterized protein
VRPGRRCAFVVQTNGVLLDGAALELLHRNDIRIGVSIDGDAASHDRHRRFANGRGSHAAVDRALRRLHGPEHRQAFAGLLCAVDLRTDPVACYEALLAYEPPLIDFLLPQANWGDPPPRPDGAEPDAYGRWLAAVFDRWYDASRRETEVRLLSEVINLVLGGASRIDQVGLSPLTTVVVETNGDIELADLLKSAYAGAPETGYNIDSHSFDDVLEHPGVRARHAGVDALSPTCRACRIHRVCGGGNYAHRYRAGSGFANPSVYCADLAHLIRHVRGRVAAGLATIGTGRM